MAWAQPVCDHLIAQGHWADYIDPCSGLPVGNDSCELLLFPAVDAVAVA